MTNNTFVRYTVIIMVLTSGCSLRAATYSDVLGRSTIQEIVTTELSRVQGIQVQPSFVDWSVTTISDQSAPRNKDEAQKVLTRGYEAFVTGVVSFAKEHKLPDLDRNVGKRFLETNKTCGPIPCNEKVCCNFCKDPCD